MTPETRKEIDTMLIKNGFCGYEELAGVILKDYGIEIPRSSLSSYGKKLEEQLARIRTSTEAARQIAEAMPDEEDQRSAAVISLVQSHLFDALLMLSKAKETEDAFERLKVVVQSAKAASDLGRAAMSQKRWQEEVRTKAEAAALAVERMARSGGVSDATLALIRREIMGIA
jgi:hypothetical protein